MAVHDRSAFVAISARLVFELDKHVPEVEDLIANWLDMEQYQRLSSSIDRMGRYCDAVPHLVGPWAEVLISHTQLIHCAWDTARKGLSVADAPLVDSLLKLHVLALGRAREAAAWVTDNRGKSH